MFSKELNDFIKKNKLIFVGYEINSKYEKPGIIFQLEQVNPKEKYTELVFIFGVKKEQEYKVHGYRLLQSDTNHIRHNTKTDFKGDEQYQLKRKINIKELAYNADKSEVKENAQIS